MTVAEFLKQIMDLQVNPEAQLRIFNGDSMDDEMQLINVYFDDELESLVLDLDDLWEFVDSETDEDEDDND